MLKDGKNGETTLHAIFNSVAYFVFPGANRKYAQTVVKFIITATKFHRITGRDIIRRL